MHSAVIRIRRTMGRDQAAAMLNIFAERCQRLSQAGVREGKRDWRERERKRGCKRKRASGNGKTCRVCCRWSLAHSSQLEWSYLLLLLLLSVVVRVAVVVSSRCRCSLLLLFSLLLLLLLMAARPQFLCFRFLSFLVFCISSFFRWQLFVLWPMQLAYDWMHTAGEGEREGKREWEREGGVKRVGSIGIKHLESALESGPVDWGFVKNKWPKWHMAMARRRRKYLGQKHQTTAATTITIEATTTRKKLNCNAANEAQQNNRAMANI